MGAGKRWGRVTVQVGPASGVEADPRALALVGAVKDERARKTGLASRIAPMQIGELDRQARRRPDSSYAAGDYDAVEWLLIH